MAGLLGGTGAGLGGGTKDGRVVGGGEAEVWKEDTALGELDTCTGEVGMYAD